MTFAALPLLLNPFTWYSQHVVEHHGHTNEVDHDVDLFHLLPFRLHKLDVRTGSLFNFLKVVIVGAHLGVGVPLNVLTGLMDKTPDGFQGGTHIKLLPIFRESIWHYIIVWITLLWALVTWVLSFFVHDGFFKQVCFTLVPFMIASLSFMIFTQVSHIQEECQADEILNTTDFFRRQALTSLDYSVDSRFWSFLSGGLNTQSLHHCMPWVNSCHYTAIYPKFVQICKKHNAQPPTVKNLSAAVKGGVKYVVKLNAQID